MDWNRCGSKTFVVGGQARFSQHRIAKTGKIWATKLGMRALSAASDPGWSEGGGGQETWKIRGRRRQPSFLWLVLTGTGGAWPPWLPSWIRSCVRPILRHFKYYQLYKTSKNAANYYQLCCDFLNICPVLQCACKQSWLARRGRV